MKMRLGSIAIVFLLSVAGAAFAQLPEKPPFRETPVGVQAAPTREEARGAAAANVSFSGGRSFSDQELRQAIARHLDKITERGLKETRANDAAFFLELFYRRNGFLDASVGYRLAGNRLILAIREGPRTRIAQVRFAGNREMEASVLNDYLIGSTRERFSRFEDELPYVEADIETGIGRLNSFYKSEGFLDARVDPAIVRYTEGRTKAHLTIPIREGRQYFFGDMRFVGELPVPRSELLAQITSDPAEPYSEVRLDAARSKLEFFLKTRGYFQAEVSATGAPGAAVAGRVPVTFTIRSGRIHEFDGITVEGLDRLPDDFLHQRFKNLRGETYDPELLEKVYRELIRTGLFSYVTYEETPLPDGTVRLDFKVEEAEAKEIGAYIGYDTDDGGIFGISYTNRNLFGTARPWTFSGQYGFRGIAGQIEYENPWLFDTDNEFRFRIYALTDEEDDYSRREIGARAELSRQITERLALSAFLHAKSASITDSQIEPQLLGPTSYELATIGITQSFGRRKNPALPERGLAVNSSFSFSSGGGNLSFGRATFQMSYYLPIGKTTLAVGARLGTIFGSSGLESIPIDERYYAGGSTTVRSFRMNELGPEDRGGIPIGGLSLSIFNVEYTFPLFGDLRGAVFVDAGSVSRKSFEFVEEMRFAIGGGLRYQLPIGPLRFDYGWNPSPKGDEPEGAFHLGFGFAF